MDANVSRELVIIWAGDLQLRSLHSA